MASRQEIINKTLHKSQANFLAGLLSSAPDANFPMSIKPMLATLVDAPFDAKGWVYEVKWDGYRALAFLNNGIIHLSSRNGESFNERFYPVVRALQKWTADAVLDGEIVVLNKKGISSFNALQNWKSEANGKLIYCVFDILWYQGKNLMKLPLLHRQLILKSIIPRAGIIHLSKTLSGSGVDAFDAAKKAGLEGILAKKADSIYRPGVRTTDWLKVKVTRRQEMVIGGYTLNHGSGRPFSALLAGVFEGKDFVYTGKIGTGFSIQAQKDLLKKFQPYIIKTSAFTEAEGHNTLHYLKKDLLHADVFFLKPYLVCEVNFTEITSDGMMRHPSFQGLRTDKRAKEVVMEKANAARLLIRKT